MLRGRGKIAVLFVAVLAAGMVFGFMLGSMLQPEMNGAEALPDDFKSQLDRLSLINTATNETLKEFKVLGGALGTYIEGGAIFETYVVGFEDRYGGAEADLDFLDVMVELKRARGSGYMTVRVVQLGLDVIDVYLDGEFLGSVKPAVEVQIET